MLEDMDIVSAIVPVDLSTAANNGDWINLKNHHRALVVLFGAAGTAGQDPVFTLLQATDASGTGSKALNFVDISSKVGTLTGVTSWTHTTQSAANTYTDAVSAETQKLIAVEVDSAMLDVDGGFTHFQLSVPDVGAAAQIGCGFVILDKARYGSSSAANPLA
jgi:hypothetical protein